MAVTTHETYTNLLAPASKDFPNSPVNLARFFNQSPDTLSYDQVTDWILHLIKERKLSPSSVNIAVNAVRFLYATTLQRDVVPLMASIPRIKRNKTRAEVYARSEVEKILTAPPQPRNRAFLMLVYGTGLRLSEALHIQVTDMDRAWGQLRIRHGKGGKERVVPTSFTPDEGPAPPVHLRHSGDGHHSVLL